MNKRLKLIVFAFLIVFTPVLLTAAGGASATFTFGSVDATLDWWGAGKFQDGSLNLDIQSPDSSGSVPVIVWCGDPGNGQIVRGNGVNPTVGDYSGTTALNASNIVRKGRVHGTVSADPDLSDPDTYASLVSNCPNPNWHVARVLPIQFVAQLTVQDTSDDTVLTLRYQCDASSVVSLPYDEVIGHEIPCTEIP